MSKTEFSFPHGNVSHDVADILTMFGNNRDAAAFSGSAVPLYGGG
jgi:hypothetical protein